MSNSPGPSHLSDLEPTDALPRNDVRIVLDAWDRPTVCPISTRPLFDQAHGLVTRWNPNGVTIPPWNPNGRRPNTLHLGLDVQRDLSTLSAEDRLSDLSYPVAPREHPTATPLAPWNPEGQRPNTLLLGFNIQRDVPTLSAAGRRPDLNYPAAAPNYRAATPSYPAGPPNYPTPPTELSPPRSPFRAPAPFPPFDPAAQRRALSPPPFIDYHLPEPPQELLDSLSKVEKKMYHNKSYILTLKLALQRLGGPRQMIDVASGGQKSLLEILGTMEQREWVFCRFAQLARILEYRHGRPADLESIARSKIGILWEPAVKDKRSLKGCPSGAIGDSRPRKGTQDCGNGSSWETQTKVQTETKPEELKEPEVFSRQEVQALAPNGGSARASVKAPRGPAAERLWFHASKQTQRFSHGHQDSRPSWRWPDSNHDHECWGTDIDGAPSCRCRSANGRDGMQ